MTPPGGHPRGVLATLGRVNATEPTTTIHVEMPDASISPVQVWQGNGDDKPLVMVWPGFGMGGYYFRPIAAELAERGFPVAIGELRGQGQSSARATRSSTWGYHDLASEDFPRQIHAVKQELGLPVDHPMIFLAHSMGGQISCLFAAREDTRELNLRGIFGVGSGSPYRPAFDPRMGRRLGVGAFFLGWVGGHGLGYWPGKILGRDFLGYGRQAGAHMREWLRFHKRNSLNDLTGQDIDYVAALSRLELPVLFTRFTNDRDCPTASSEALAEFLPNADVRFEDLPGELGHNRWAREPGIVADRFVSFAGLLD